MSKVAGQSIVRWMDRIFYPGYAENWDDILFRNLILSKICSSMSVLDLGAGAGIVPQMNFKEHALCVCGLDPDERVLRNPYLHEGKIGFGESIPYADSTFDMVVSDNVLEHLPSPDKVFAEIARVLKPGGIFLVKTPNKWHYVPIIARMSPLWFHRFVVGWRGREGDDVFPTRYLANTASDINRICTNNGFDVVRIDYVDGRPEYLRFSFLTYFLGWLYEKLVTNIYFLRFFRVLLIVELQKSEVN